MVYIIAHLKAHAGKGDEVVALAAPLVASTRKESGCISYELCRKVAEPDTLVVVESWMDKAAVDAHFSEPHPHLRAFQAAELLAGARIEVIHPEKVEVI